MMHLKRAVLLVIGVVIASLLVTGVVLRRAREHDTTVDVPVPPSIKEFDAHLGWSLKPGSVGVSRATGERVEYRINSKGLRGPETTYQKPQGIFRILLLGDACTFGLGVPLERHYSSLLEGVFRNVEVINLGVDGDGLDQMLLRLQAEGVNYEPDVVIAYVHVPVVGPQPYELAEARLLEMEATSCKLGASFVLVTNDPELHRRLDSQGITSHAVSPALSSQSFLLPNHLGHLNADGHAALARELAAFLQSHGLIPAPHVKDGPTPAPPSPVCAARDAERRAPAFADVSQAAGLSGLRSTHGSPVPGDFDNDGDVDVFVYNHYDDPPELLRNEQGAFVNVFPASGILRHSDRHGAAWGDYDNDGAKDLFITVGARQGEAIGKKRDELYHNDGGGHFTDVTDAAGVLNAYGRGRSVNWVDFDRDGSLDLFVKNIKTPNVFYRNNGNGTFADVAPAAGLADAPGMISSWADYDQDGDMDLFLTAGSPQLWMNRGDGTFVEVTDKAHLSRARGNGWGVAWGDYDNDGDLDLFVASGLIPTEHVFAWNRWELAFFDFDVKPNTVGGADFVTTGTQVHVEFQRTVCRLAQQRRVKTEGRALPEVVSVTIPASGAPTRPWSPLSADDGVFLWKARKTWHLRWRDSSDPDFLIYVTGAVTSNGQLVSVQPLVTDPIPPLFSLTSSLYRNNGDGTFTDVAYAAGIRRREDGRGAAWADVDNDGDLDLYVVTAGDLRRNRADTLYVNRGDGTFEQWLMAAGEADEAIGRGDGLAWFDVDRDGFLDLFLTHGGFRRAWFDGRQSTCHVRGPHRLYKNLGSNGNGWLMVTLVGRRSNRDGIGAKIVLRAMGVTQLREVNSTGYLYSQSAAPAHFGLAQATVVDSLTVKWPSGITQTLTDIAPNQALTIVEADQSLARAETAGDTARRSASTHSAPGYSVSPGK